VSRKKKYINGFAVYNDLRCKKFGRLLAINPVRYDPRGFTCWEFLCDCGTTAFINGDSVVSGSTKSCGCLKREYQNNLENIHKLPYGDAAFNSLYYNYKQGAKKRNLEFILTKEDVRILTSKNCFYCGAIPSQHTNTIRHGNYIYNGIDRVNNFKGYTLDNCVPCCGDCNKAKRQKTKEEFIQWVSRVYTHCLIEVQD